MDGTRSIRELQQMFSPENPEEINTIVRNLDARGLLDDVAQFRGHSGMDTLLDLEELANELLNKHAEKHLFNRFRRSI